MCLTRNYVASLKKLTSFAQYFKHKKVVTMENDLLKELAETLLNTCIPAQKKDAEAYFVDKQGLINLIKFNGEYKHLNKVLRSAGFNSGFKKIGDKTVRGYWIKDSNGTVDVSKITFEKPKPEKETILVLNTVQDAINYISDNWDDFKNYISPELRKIHIQDPRFKAISSQKRTRLLEQAGFETKQVLNTADRHIYEYDDSADQIKIPVPKTGNAMEILHPFFFPNSLPMENKIGYTPPQENP